MKKIVLVAIVAVIMLFSNIQPVRAQVQEALGVLQALSLLLPSKNDNNPQKLLTGEELIKKAANQDILPSDCKPKKKVIEVAKGHGLTIDFGKSVENIIVGNYVAA